MKKIVLLLGAVVLFTACNRAPKENSEAKADAAPVEITSISVAQALADPASLVNKEVSITGMVTHVCKHGGQKLFIIDEDPEKQLRINVGEGIPEFDIALEGSTVTFTGTFKILSTEETEAMQGENKEMHEEEHANPEAHTAAEESEYFIEAVSVEPVAKEE